MPNINSRLKQLGLGLAQIVNNVIHIRNKYDVSNLIPFFSFKPITLILQVLGFWGPMRVF